MADIESDRVERKESAKDKISQAICAFANDLPGYGTPGVLFVGVANDGRCGGLAVTDDLLLSLADLRDQGNILPPPSMIVRKVRLDGCDLAVVEVQPSTAPPVSYKGRIYIRVGPGRGIANLDDERRLNERRRVIQRLEGPVPSVADDPYCLAQLKHYRSLIPMGQEARKPIFALKPADGAFGGHAQAAQRAYGDFRSLATALLSQLSQAAA